MFWKASVGKLFLLTTWGTDSLQAETKRKERRPRWSESMKSLTAQPRVVVTEPVSLSPRYGTGRQNYTHEGSRANIHRPGLRHARRCGLTYPLTIILTRCIRSC